MRNTLLLLLTLMPVLVFGQTVEVEGIIRYYAEPSLSPKEAKMRAVEQARIEALGRKFGTLITQDELSQMDNQREYFSQLSTSEVKGEWIKDLTPPEVKLIETTPDDIFVYEAKVRGLARPVSNDAADFETFVLRNGTDKRYISTDFKESDKLYLYFKAPSDGYVAAFMIDEQQNVFCLLPHESSLDGLQKVKHDQEYIFFSKQYDADFEYGDGLNVTCADEHLELNRIYIIFSPKSFVKPNVSETTSIGQDGFILPRQLGLKEFSKWMTTACSRDKQMGRKVIRIKITK